MRHLRIVTAAVLAAGAAGCWGGGGSGGGSGGRGGTARTIADIAGGYVIGVEHGVLFYAFDTLAYPGEPVELTARLQSGTDLGGLGGAAVGFFRDDEKVGEATTDEAGYAGVSWTPPEAGDYEFTVRVLEPPDEEHEDAVEVTPAPLLVAARDKQAEFAVIDLDHTVVASSFWRVLLGGARPMADAAAVTGKLAGRYSVIYLTHRPDILTRKSKRWLVEHGFPRGPLLVSELAEVFAGSGEFKTAKLAALKEKFPNVRLGIGDKLSDAQAYVDNGLRAYLIPHYKEKPEDMEEAARAIRALEGRGRLHVVSSWREIEQGVLEEASFPPGRFAERLLERAGRLRDEKRRRKKRDD
jgi:hypothetical protein